MCGPENRQGVLGDHPFLVGGNDVDWNAAFVLRYLQRVPGVLGGIEQDPKPCKLFGHPGTDRRRVFSNAGGEDESVDPLQRSRQHPGTEPYSVSEVVDGKGGTPITALQQLAHVVAYAGQAFQPAVAVEKVLYFSGRHRLFGHQVEHHAGIDLARSRSHWQTIEGSKAHGAFDTPAALEGAHRSAAAEM